MHKRVCDALRAGNSLRTAVAYAGIEWVTWCKWRRRVKSGDRFHDGVAALVDEYERAMAEGTAALVAQINLHAKEDFRAAQFLVERRDEHAEREERVKKLRAERKLAELRLAQGGVEKHEHTVVTPDLAASLAREVFGSPSALERKPDGSSQDRASDVAGNVLPLPAPVDK